MHSYKTKLCKAKQTSFSPRKLELLLFIVPGKRIKSVAYLLLTANRASWGFRRLSSSGDARKWSSMARVFCEAINQSKSIKIRHGHEVFTIAGAGKGQSVSS